MKELPKVKYKDRIFVFDYNLSELREVKDNSIWFIKLNHNQRDLLDYAIRKKNKKLIEINLREILRCLR